MSIFKSLATALVGGALATLWPSSSALADDGHWSPFERDDDLHGVEWIGDRDRHDRDDDQHAHRKPFTIKIIGFNDYHGNLDSHGTFGVNTSVPLAQRPAVGGAEFVAAHVAKLKASNPLNVVVGAGDFIGASPLVSALFFDEPAVETLNKVGVEFNSVGNHEFDKGSAELKRLQCGGCKITNGVTDPNSCKGLGSQQPGTFDGAKFQWLAANVIDALTAYLAGFKAPSAPYNPADPTLGKPRINRIGGTTCPGGADVNP